MIEKYNNLKQPLGLYDIFGYILPGFFFYALFIIDFDGSKLLRYFIENNTTKGMLDIEGDFKLKYFLDFIYYDSNFGVGIITFIIFLIFCYLTGHIMASFSSFLSKQFVRRFLNYPSENLFPHDEALEKKGWFYRSIRWLYQKLGNISKGIFSLNYKKPFEENFRVKFKKTIDKAMDYEVDRKDYYWITYSNICVVRPDLVKRIQHFVNLAGFARNVMGTFLFYLIIRISLFSWYMGCALDEPVWMILIGFTLIMMVMFWTYLRLFKRQAVDMFYIYVSIYNSKSDVKTK